MMSAFKCLALFLCLFVITCGDDISVNKNGSSDSSCISVNRDSINRDGSSDSSIPSSYTLVWEDEFDSGNQPDSSYWTYDIGSKLLGGTVWGNSEKQYYTDTRTNSCIVNDRLVIQAKRETHSNAPEGHGIVATSARIKTDTEAYFNAIGKEPYGFYEVRAKIHCFAGAWPAIWLLGKGAGWPAGGEIDIMEWAGKYNSKTTVISAFHTTATVNGNSIKPNSGTQSIPDLCTEYHKYQLHWTENEIVMGVDGSETLKFSKEADFTNDEWPFHRPAFLILNVAVGGNLGGVVNDNTEIDKMKLEVDYVRIWQKPE